MLNTSDNCDTRAPIEWLHQYFNEDTTSDKGYSANVTWRDDEAGITEMNVTIRRLDVV